MIVTKIENGPVLLVVISRQDKFVTWRYKSIMGLAEISHFYGQGSLTHGLQFSVWGPITYLFRCFRTIAKSGC